MKGIKKFLKKRSREVKKAEEKYNELKAVKGKGIKKR